MKKERMDGWLWKGEEVLIGAKSQGVQQHVHP
jgi:hypothetical protein